jgi:hypothetical protein
LPFAMSLQASSISSGMSSVLAKSLAVPRGRSPRSVPRSARKSTTELTVPSPPPRIRNSYPSPRASCTASGSRAGSLIG